MHPAVNTDTLSMPRPGTISRALIQPCLLIQAVCWDGQERSKATPKLMGGGGDSCDPVPGGRMPGLVYSSHMARQN